MRKPAGTVGLALNVQPGKALVMVLGTGSGQSNQEALELWVMQMLIERDLLPTRGAIPLLIESWKTP
ncbi:hypothetical protein [Halomonas daqiaonensis]|uniref:Uncharacterized protein n=1 Tax=Halomonas daqiaonensis TaxID=650850 RepID=A0A1H7WA21_9GAMM|nr:hypothetical protein [Halomonas daqiaonensis]SEM17838.1 hypothetical protein SAMN04488129_13027 [Halomonas daqiaonensis]